MSAPTARWALTGRVRARRADFAAQVAHTLCAKNAARRTGSRIVEVDPAYTSQTCHSCGYVAEENRESPSVFRCGRCGHTAHADVNAAQNILTRGWTNPSG
ncbi:zinc ribbon domain-containing protein [Nocardiopsis deserti]|uniref:zinc ribbon domain-containing protein n=1 Tax=Nocardiopsis deserti TaxID=2605988 RepID=UPI001CC2381A|nr:zinc ribbon domain-containing protein [Nocardiopsis deserti]